MGFNSNVYTHIICVYHTEERICTHEGGSVAILSDNGTEFKNTVLDDACE